MEPLRLMAILAHPDDESLGCGGVLAKYAAEGIDTFLVTATRGQRGRFNGHPEGDPEHPGEEGLAAIRETELRSAALALGIRDVAVLDYRDKDLDRAEPGDIIGRLVSRIRQIRPQVVVTFGPDGIYGHPDHIAISQFATAAVVSAADPAWAEPAGEHQLLPHAVSKLYYLILSEPLFAAYQWAFRRLSSTVDGRERQAVPWPDWAITTVVDTRDAWETVWRAVTCHSSQVSGYARLKELSPEHHEALWGRQCLYRVFSAVNGGRAVESDLFEGVRT